ncbi:MAG: hypothetical protein JW751_31385 [Polyangiaceae bacterium]|nr:hypothetical protein [Polyangiaceae bacterium]
MTKRQTRDFLRECRQYHGGKPRDGLFQATGAFLGHAARNPSALTVAAAELPRLPPAGAAWLSIALGSAIEDGADPELTGPSLLAHFRAWLPRLPAPSTANNGGEEGGEPERFEPTQEQHALFATFPQLCQGVVAHLARMPSARDAMADDASLLERLEELSEHSHGAAWVHEAILRTSGSLLVLHPPSGQGLVARYSNVATCFHLFSLLQACIGPRLPGGREPDPNVTAAARGRNVDPINDHAWWHYGDPRSPAPEIAASIWGERWVRSLPLVDGKQVILLWPPIVASRSWDSGFFGPHLEALPADATLERALDETECHDWLARLAIDGR